MFCFEHNSLNYKMNHIINKFLLARDKFMPEMHLRQTGFSYSACAPLTKKKRTAADKVLRDKAFNIAKNPKYVGYPRGLASMVYKFFDKKTKGSGVKSIPQNEQLADELHKLIIRKF